MQRHGIGARWTGNIVANGQTRAFRLVQRIFRGVGNGTARIVHVRLGVEVDIGQPESILRVSIIA
jgi:hypothetical protein